MTTSIPKRSRAEMEDLRKKLVTSECWRRTKLHIDLTPQKGDSKEIKEAKARAMLMQLQKWAGDMHAFIQDCGWAPDPKGTFGAGAVPDGSIAPQGMVPLIPFPRQVEFIKKFEELLALPDGEEATFAAVKSRQVAFTTFGLWCAIHAWLFRGSTTGFLSTYKDIYIDAGGKGQRDADSMFGRLRTFLDALMWQFPVLKFNAHAAPRPQDRAFKKWNENKTGLLDHEDITMKLSRPRWTVHGNVMFPKAEKNWLKGGLPGDSTARSTTCTFVIFDEIGQYDDLGAGTADKAWGATAANTKVRFAWGTIPEGGGPGTKFYKLMEETPESKIHHKIWCHWSDIKAYNAGAGWTCRSCKDLNPWQDPYGPGRDGEARQCGKCGYQQQVSYRDMVSPWFLRQCELLHGDKLAIARELQMDWMAAQGDVFFASVDPHQLIRPARPNANWIAFDGFDPGHSIDNPASWICGFYNPDTMEVQIMGYWMAANQFVEYFVPFLKRWSAARTRRTPLTYGVYAGKGTFAETFQYPPEAYEVMDYLASSNVPLGKVYGDKFGSHRVMAASPYDILEQGFGIIVDCPYTKDREALVKRGQDWASRMAISDKIAEIRPPTPLKGRYPSIFQVFTTAKPRPNKGEGTFKLDVSKEDPPHVNHACDAWFYLCRAFEGDTVHYAADSRGQFAPDPHTEAEILNYADDIWG